ncbi:glycosyltransferase [Candidatus Halobeggiatoa sp. HSG11]|nr:glycosyltransferase [Candidatus Halobeggiatoa sp. HSG11]
MSKILHIGKFFPPFFGGIETFLSDLVSEQVKQGEEIRIIAHNHEFGVKNKFEWEKFPEGYQILRVPCHGLLLYSPISPLFPLWFNQAIKEFKPDILHIHMPNTSAFWSLILLKALKIPWVIHWHSDIVLSKFDRRLILAYTLYYPFEQLMLAKTSSVISTSPPYATKSIALKFWQKKLSVIPLGIKESRLPTATKNSLNTVNSIWGDDTFKVLTIGRLTYYKGHTILLNALKYIDNVKLILVGTGELKPQLLNQVDELKLSDKIEILDNSPSYEFISALLTTCDCFCLPSIERTEAFGVVLLEASYYSKPIVSCQIEGSGVTWVIKDGNTGILVPPNDVKSLASALNYLNNNPNEAMNLGIQAKNRFNEVFNINKISKMISRLYESIL